MMRAIDMIGEVNESELMELSGAAEVEQRSSWACAIIPPVIIYTIQDSSRSCPTTSCSTRC